MATENTEEKEIKQKNTTKKTTTKEVKDEAKNKEEKTVKKETKAKTTTKKATTKTVKEESKKEEKIDKDVTISGLSFKNELILIYFIPISIIFALLKDRKVSDELRFHYNQSATSFIIILCLYVFGFIPYVGIVSRILIFVVYIFNIIALVKAYNDEVYNIPLISDLSKNIF